MTRLLVIVLIAFVPLAQAGIGDIYHCEKTWHKYLSHDKVREVGGTDFGFAWNNEGITFRLNPTVSYERTLPFERQDESASTFLASFSDKTVTIVAVFKDGEFTMSNFRHSAESGSAPAGNEVGVLLAHCREF